MATPPAPVVEKVDAGTEITIPNATSTVKTEVKTEVKTAVKKKSIEPITDSKIVKKYVENYFSDIPLLARVAECESHNRQYTKSGQVIRGEVNSLDVGVMQINEKYHLEQAKKLGYDIYTMEGNTAYARYLYEKQGAQPWISSSPCWAKFSESEIAQS